MKKCFLIMSCLLLIVGSCWVNSNCFAYAQTSAKAMVVIAVNDNKILYAKNENQKLPMASTTKIITALTVINNASDLDKQITIPKVATLVPGTSIYLKQGEVLTIRQLLYGLMLQSGNDAATALAIAVGGDIGSFCSMMNETAKQCGATNSQFKNPHGLDEDGHFTTATDLAKITAKALQNKDFREIVSCKYFQIDKGENTTCRKLTNKNRLLNTLPGCIGVKTGYTSRAGRCLVSAVERNGMQVVCVVLNCGPMFEESQELIEKAFDEYSLVEILPSYNFVADVPVKNGKKPSVKIYSKNGCKKVLSKAEKEKVSISYDYPDELLAPLTKEQNVGEVKININNDLIFVEKLYIMEEVKSTNVTDKIKEIIDNWKS